MGVTFDNQNGATEVFRGALLIADLQTAVSLALLTMTGISASCRQ